MLLSNIKEERLNGGMANTIAVDDEFDASSGFIKKKKKKKKKL